MPMNPGNLKNELEAAIKAQFGKDPDDGQVSSKFYTALANAIVEHIRTNATLSGTIGVTSDGKDVTASATGRVT